MARSLWKGKTILKQVYKRFWDGSDTESSLFRRNMQILPEMVDKNFLVYNGYDSFKLNLTTKHLNLNLATLVLTRELEVRHKVKVSKGARKNQVLKLKKKGPSDKKNLAKKKVSLRTTPNKK